MQETLGQINKRRLTRQLSIFRDAPIQVKLYPYYRTRPYYWVSKDKPDDKKVGVYEVVESDGIEFERQIADYLDPENADLIIKALTEYKNNKLTPINTPSLDG